jgi:hypothetical protein
MGTTSQWFTQLAQLSMLVIWLVGFSQFGNLARPASRTAGFLGSPGQLANWYYVGKSRSNGPCWLAEWWFGQASWLGWQS